MTQLQIDVLKLRQELNLLRLMIARHAPIMPGITGQLNDIDTHVSLMTIRSLNEKTYGVQHTQANASPINHNSGQEKEGQAQASTD